VTSTAHITYKQIRLRGFRFYAVQADGNPVGSVTPQVVGGRTVAWIAVTPAGEERLTKTRGYGARWLAEVEA
jgi:hypothetical protein